MKNNDVIRQLLEVERRELSSALKAKTSTEIAEHRRKADAAKNCRERLQNKGYQRSDGGRLYTAQVARERDELRKQIKAMLKGSGK